MPHVDFSNFVIGFFSGGQPKQKMAQVFSCEFCKISKNTFFRRTPLVAASANSLTIDEAKNAVYDFQARDNFIVKLKN